MRNLFAILILWAGCGGSGNVQREPDEYVGCGTDELWAVFDSVENQSTVSDDSGPQITQPASGMTFTDAPIIAWKPDPSTSAVAEGDVPHDGPGCTNCCEQWNTGAIDGGLQTLHEPPVSGDIYDLQFSAGGKVVWRVVTTLNEWRAPTGFWTSLKGQTVTLHIWRIAVIMNTKRDGPYTPATAFTFTAM